MPTGIPVSGINKGWFKAGMKRTLISRRKQSFSNMGEKNPHWRGGKSITTQGYVLASIGNGKYMLEHRLVMERFLKRKLAANELIHHKDGNKQNNKLKNLELINRSIHAGNHGKINCNLLNKQPKKER